MQYNGKWILEHDEEGLFWYRDKNNIYPNSYLRPLNEEETALYERIVGLEKELGEL
ncbi:MAG: hypothetical protein WCO84_05835 [bacterium]